jgi:hypothetical protein
MVILVVWSEPQGVAAQVKGYHLCGTERSVTVAVAERSIPFRAFHLEEI